VPLYRHQRCHSGWAAGAAGHFKTSSQDCCNAKPAAERKSNAAAAGASWWPEAGRAIHAADGVWAGYHVCGYDKPEYAAYTVYRFSTLPSVRWIWRRDRSAAIALGPTTSTRFSTLPSVRRIWQRDRSAAIALGPTTSRGHHQSGPANFGRFTAAVPARYACYAGLLSPGAAGDVVRGMHSKSALSITVFSRHAQKVEQLVGVAHG
jgi:hypothetical protein